MSSMNAVWIENPVKSLDEVKIVQVPKPKVGAGEALVKIKVAASNPADRLIFVAAPIAGWGFPTVAGFDFSGIVEEVGEGVTNVKRGDAVFACNWNTGSADPKPALGGAFAEYISLTATKLCKKPDELSFETAAAISCVGLTAHQTLVKVAKVSKGTKLLILGGSSAVGTVAIQLAKHLGAHVTTTASTRSLSYVQQFGADKVINYNETKWEEDPQLQNTDVILDCISENEALPRALSSGVAKSGGVFISIANMGLGFNPAAYPPLSWGGFHGSHQDPSDQQVVAELAAAGKIRVPIEASFPFTTDGIVQMIGKTLGGKSLGKNIVLIS